MRGGSGNCARADAPEPRGRIDQHVLAREQMLREIRNQVVALELGDRARTDLGPQCLCRGKSTGLRSESAAIRRDDCFEDLWLFAQLNVTLREHCNERGGRHAYVDRRIDRARTIPDVRDACVGRLRELAHVARNGDGRRNERKQRRPQVATDSEQSMRDDRTTALDDGPRAELRKSTQNCRCDQLIAPTRGEDIRESRAQAGVRELHRARRLRSEHSVRSKDDDGNGVLHSLLVEGLGFHRERYERVDRHGDAELAGRTDGLNRRPRPVNRGTIPLTVKSGPDIATFRSSLRM